MKKSRARPRPGPSTSRSVFDPAINKSGGGNRIMFSFFCTNKGQTNEGLISLPWCFLFTFIYEIFVKLHQNFAERLKNFNCHQTRFLNPSSEGPRREAVVNINIHPPIPEVFILHPTSLQMKRFQPFLPKHAVW